MKIKEKICISSFPSCQILPFEKLCKVLLSSIVPVRRAAGAAVLPHRLQLCSHPAETLGDGSQPPDGGQRVQGLVGFGGIDVNPEPAQGQPAPHRFPRHLPSVVLSAGITGALVAPFHPCCCASPRPGVFPTPAPTHLRLPAEGLFALPHEKAAALLSGSESSPAMAACPGRNRSRQTPSEPRDVPGCPSRPPDATAGAGGSQGPPTTSAGGPG